MTRAELAKTYFTSGYNCAQSVALAFADLCGLPKEELERVTVGFGAGMGRLREVCGCVSGGVAVLGEVFFERPKSEVYALVQALARGFAEENGSYLCGELLTGAGVSYGKEPTAEARTEAYYKKRPCAELAASAARLLEKLLQEQGKL